jgi:hypothetical protein
MLGKLNRYATGVGILLITAALIAGMVGCGDGGGYNPPPSQNLEIRTWYDLDDVRDNLAGNHTLMNDLNSTTPGYEELAGPTANGGKGWEPIGFIERWHGYSGPGLFWGTFDGQGHEIRDLFINRPDESYVGLFGVVGDGGVIKDTAVMNCTVTGNHSVGGLLGSNAGTVSNCYCSGKVTGDEYIGGLVGLIIAHGVVRYSYSTSNVTGNLQIGGLAGRDTGTVSNSYSTGSVTGNDSVGGLVGYAFFGSVSDSYSTSSVTGENCVGGLVGLNDEVGNNMVTNSYSTGSVSGNEYVGGLIGSNGDRSTVNNSYSTGSVTGTSYVGGLVGTNGGNVTNSFWDMKTSGQSTSDGGTGKNTTEMQDIITFLDEGWNITAVANPGTRNPSYIWNIVNEVTYPFLSWQPV